MMQRNLGELNFITCDCKVVKNAKLEFSRKEFPAMDFAAAAARRYEKERERDR
jgi:hypothetical protein